MDFHIRWMIRKDLRRVLEIESGSFDTAWDEGDFLRTIRMRNCIGMVVRDGNEVVGFMVYELHKYRLHLLNLAVDAQYRRQGVGAMMIDKLINKLSYERRSRIMLEVRETNLGGQCFFRAKGFKAVSVLREFWDDTNEDAYLMQYRYVPTEDDLRNSGYANAVVESRK